MHVKKDDVPLLAPPNDQLWIVFRDFEPNAVIWVESIDANVTVQVASGPVADPLQLGAPTTLTFTQAGTRQLVQLPIGGLVTNRATSVLPTVGRISVAMAAPSDFRFFSSPVNQPQQA
jgi:hypothetical protein